MKPFDIERANHGLRDANDKLIEIVPVPGDDVLEMLTVQRVNESAAERLNLISNIPDEADEETELWKYSDVPAKVTKLTVEKIMVELAGKSWFEREEDCGYSLGYIMDLLSEKAFVQLSELTLANIKACLGNGGKIIAYFPELVWREYFNQLPYIPKEILGMRTIEIEEAVDKEGLIINDMSSADGRKMLLEYASFGWLAKDGWMLEVYK